MDTVHDARAMKRPMRGDVRNFARLHADGASLPSVLRKLLCLRWTLLSRALRRSRALRHRWAMGTLVVVLIVCMVRTLLLHPTHTPAPPSLDFSRNAAALGAPVDAASAASAAAASAASAAAATSAAPVRAHRLSASALTNESYLADLWQRATDLHLEISRFQGGSAEAKKKAAESKQRQLRRAALMLDTELAQLKEQEQKLHRAGASRGGTRGAARGVVSSKGGGGSDGRRSQATRNSALPLDGGADEASGCEESGARHGEFRIAMLLPWCGEGDQPAWLPFLIRAAATSSFLVDW